MSSKDVVYTDARFKKAIQFGVSDIVTKQVASESSRIKSECKLKTGTVTKYYPYLDKAEVQLENSNELVLCRLPHRFNGAIIDLFTPVGTRDYCEKLHEPCILPLDPLYCVVMDIDNDNSDDYFLLSYFLSDELVEFVPPAQGNVRISALRIGNEDYVEFGAGGFKVVSKTPIDARYGEFEYDLTKSEYADSDSVYTKDEVYTKEEVDELIRDKIAEALGEDNNDTS